MSALESASKYLNNLLLARGLLQDGKPIDFAHPGHGQDGTDPTMSKIINLVHDLVLRRDREADQHETMAASIRALRTSEAQRMLGLQQLQDKNQQLTSDAVTAQSQERAMRTSMRKLEHQTKELKEQNLKMKSMLDQVRAKCTSDVRKRDVEIEKLRGHLIGLQRGRKELGGLKTSLLNAQTGSVSKSHRNGQDTTIAGWALEKESHRFLTALVNETSTENVSLRQIVNDTLRILTEMSGYGEQQHDTEDEGIGIPGQYRKSRHAGEKITPVDSLAEHMDTVLQHCRSILRDPSFVPIEEVQIRDEEIVKLRAGWEKMADRWKEVVTMMGQWKQRMTLEGKSTDALAFSDFSFNRSVAIRPDGQPVLSNGNELSFIFEESKLEEGTIFLEPSQLESDLELEPGPAMKRLASSPARRGVKLPRLSQPLGEISGNDGPVASRTRALPHALEFDVDSDSEEVDKICTGSSGQKKLTIPEKLAAIEAEAANAVSINLSHPDKKRKSSGRHINQKRPGRRRSTLSPEELASMMGAR